MAAEKILYSTNGGANWIAQPTSHTTSIFGIDFINSTTGFAAGGNAFAGIGETIQNNERRFELESYNFRC
jgi:hypothetical protein